jgi:hypothetical protein
MLGLGLGILVVSLIFIFLGFILFKETMTHRFWQSKVDEGDIEMITQLVQVEVERWRTERPPKGTPAAVWQGIQGVELVEVGEDFIHASTTAESQFAMVGGKRREVSSALDEAKRITARLAERFYYDIPHIRPERIQIDCYSTFQEAGSAASQSCIVSTESTRDDVAEIDWENDSPEVIAERLGARYELDDRGVALPITPNGLPSNASDSTN